MCQALSLRANPLDLTPETCELFVILGGQSIGATTFVHIDLLDPFPERHSRGGKMPCRFIWATTSTYQLKDLHTELL